MQYRKLSELKKLEGNPRIIRNKQFKTLCQSIKDNPKYFEARPLILSNRTGDLVIIAGNQRYEAAKAVKLKEVPTFLIEGLTEEKEREIIIRDNVANGEWDFSVLANEWDTLPLIDWGVQLSEDWLRPQNNTSPINLEDAPESIKKNIEELEEFKALRKKGNEQISTKTDTEKYVVIIFNDRNEKISFLQSLGLPDDERYIPARSLEVKRCEIVDYNLPKSAPIKKAGSTG